MPYSDIQTAVLVLVRASDPIFGAKNTAEYDMTVLDASGAISAVLRRAGDTDEADAFDGHEQFGKRQQRHQVGVLVAAKIGQKKDAHALALLQTTVEALATYLRARPVLGGVAGVKYAHPRLQSRPLGINRAGLASATHWASTLVIEVYEEIDAGWIEAGQ